MEGGTRTNAAAAGAVTASATTTGVTTTSAAAANVATAKTATIEGPRASIEHGSPLYPLLLSQIEDPPRVLHVIGSYEALGPCLAIVGARKATPYGIACAKRFASIAARSGVTVISGGAIGCDQAAHGGALDAGGKTVVVFGSGANVPYPKRGRGLFDRAVAAGGAIVSELPWGTPPQKWAFRKRNRIIAGMAAAVLIVEAGLPSGTFSTADYALSVGREVMVVPGSILSRESKGSNALLAQGATPIIDDATFEESLARIFGSCSPSTCCESGMLPLPLQTDASQGTILSMLAASPMSADQVIAAMDQGVLETMKDLSVMEARGLVTRYPDGRFGIVPEASP